MINLENKRIDEFNNQKRDLVNDFVDLISSRTFKSTLRIAIIVLLGINGPLTFTDLQRSLRIGKGSLKNHLDVLETEDFIKGRNVITLNGPRLVYQITDKGREFYNKYIDLFDRFKLL
ncbi:transcriptional regulator [Picrophilus oshimae]|uniref:Conserved hypothetical membrane protein n=1 Tax=Picrophilus torridus (strain ATCC 700027 / DSM 9790 / JCM 10055 / NBRC 100828 / KAW 2/3) TaxID=1122961 RepID=Q6L0K3_PICTO|nr:transcriptional regulator [Picrophilus oshimae]AAT43499.1 conserved hypothetical membrane protein [Picrophilus oshimae DSM 9789]SMD30192.1 transcriptional regulator, HxlR family [Picrophilus oshimae DSM 9789]